jgi:hypothetical protein
MVVISNFCFNIVTYLNKWFFLESPFLLFYFEFCNCQVLMLMTDKRQRMFICHSRCFGIRGGHGKSAFKLAVKLSVELGYFFLSLRL